MKHLIFLGLIVGLLVGCQPVEDVVIDSFEGPINKETVDYGAAEGSSVTVSSSTDIVQCGDQSLRVEYNLKPSGYMWIARGYGLDVKGAGDWEVEPKAVPWKKYKAIKLYMYGRNSGAVIAFDIKDAKGELWRFLLDDDFTGWKEIICPLKEFFPRTDWQPETAERNEVLDFPIMSYQFEPRMPGQSVYYFDCVTVTQAEE